MITTWVNGQSSASSLSPLAVSDFKNGSYSLDGVAASLGDIWIEDVVNWGPFTGENIVPGSGFQTDSGELPIASPALLELIDPVGEGFSAVINFNVTALTGNQRVDCVFDLYDEPQEVSWAVYIACLTATNTIAPTPPKTTDVVIRDAGTVDEGLVLSSGTTGRRRYGLTMSDTGIDVAGEGSSLSVPIGDLVTLDMTNGVFALYSIPADGSPGYTNGGTAFVESIVFYPKLPIAKLKALTDNA